MSTKKMGRPPKYGKTLTDRVVIRLNPEIRREAEIIMQGENVGTATDLYRRALEIGLQKIAEQITAGSADIWSKSES